MSLERPFYSNQKGLFSPSYFFDPRYDLFISVQPSEWGAPSIWDKDAMYFIIAATRLLQEKGADVDKGISFKPTQLLKFCRRGTGGKDIQELHTTLRRLKGSVIQTNVPSDGEVEQKSFSLLTDLRVVHHESGRLSHIEVSVCDWLLRSVKAGDILSIPFDYFDISSATERRLYELIRKHCGTQPKFTIRVERLHKKTGLTDSLNNFVVDLKDILTRSEGWLLDYRVVLKNDQLYCFSTGARGIAAYAKFVCKLVKL